MNARQAIVYSLSAMLLLRFDTVDRPGPMICDADSDHRLRATRAQMVLRIGSRGNCPTGCKHPVTTFRE